MDATFQLDQNVFNYRVAAVLIHDGHVLLHKQALDEHWALPGGRVKVLEDSKTSIKRELKEELGFSAAISDLLWFTENFFTYKERKFHELGLYYKASLLDAPNAFQTEPFYGLEGERLIYQWVPFHKLEEIVLYPEFLKTSIQNLPQVTQHFIIEQYDM